MMLTTDRVLTTDIVLCGVSMVSVIRSISPVEEYVQPGSESQ